MERFEIREGFNAGLGEVSVDYQEGDIVFAEIAGTDLPDDIDIVPPPEGVTADWYYIPNDNIVVSGYYLFPYPETDVIAHVKSNWPWYLAGTALVLMAIEASKDNKKSKKK